MWRYAVLAGALCIGALTIAVGSRYGRAEAPAPAPFQSHVDGRIRYPAGRYPTLESPDGTKHEVRSLLDIKRPLHFGDYGGMPLKLVWTVMTLATIWILWTGVLLWLRRSPGAIERRLTEIESGGALA